MNELIITLSPSKGFTKIRNLFFVILTMLIGCSLQGRESENLFFQQELEVTGTVVNQDNIPLPGVAVAKKDSDTGTVTDFDGNYIIPVKIGDLIIFSFTGYKEQSITYSGQKN